MMNKALLLVFRFVCFLLVAGLAVPVDLARAGDGEPPVSPDPLAPLSLVDNFGYTYTTLSPLILESEATQDQKLYDPYWPEGNRFPVTFPGGQSLSDVIDFNVLDATVPIYNFPFYEQVLHNLQVSVNGLVRFNLNTDEDRFNFPLPTGDKSPVAPTNFIAPLWGEFVRNVDNEYPENNTQIWYRFFNDFILYTGHQALVIGWENLRHVETDELCSFAVALLDNGDIYVLLKQLPVLALPHQSDYTIGLNNSDGEDGLTYYHDGILADDADVSAMLVVNFQKPSPNWRVKATPYLQGGFTQDGKTSFSFDVHNITDLISSTSDTYNLSYDLSYENTPPPEDWEVQFFAGDWSTPITNTGNLLKNQSKPINLRVTAPAGAQPGDSVLVTINIVSQQTSLVDTQVAIRVSVPVGFLEAYQDASGGYENLIWALNQSTSYIFADATNNNLGVGDYQGGFVMASEQPPILGKSSVGYAFVDKLGFLRKYGKVNNAGFNDHFPAIGVPKSTGLSGLAWVRDKTVMFTVLDPVLLVIKYAPKTVSTPPSAYAAGYPAVAALENGHFLVAWPDGSAENVYKLKLAHLDAGGTVLGITETTTFDNVQGVSLLPLPDSWGASKAFLAFVSRTGTELQLSTAVVSFSGNAPVISSQAVLSSAKVSLDSPSTSLAAVAGDKVLLAWVDTQVVFTNKSNFLYFDQGIKYALFSSPGSSQVGSLMVPNWLQAANVSAGADKDGNGILVWSDSQTGRYLYYALIDPALDPSVPGSKITPAMIHAFTAASSFNLSSSGQSLALFGGRRQVFLPIVMK